MTQRPFQQVDVFTDKPYLGNPLAVVLDGTQLSDQQMKRFASWTHLSETTFLLPPTQPGADYRVRIFTPSSELPFAGHPTLGSCHAWLRAGGVPRHSHEVVQECAVGLVRIRRDHQRLAFAAPALRRSPVPLDLVAKVAAALGIDTAHIRASQMLVNGPHWLGLLLDDPQTVLALEPDHFTLRELGVKVGVAAMTASSAAPGLIARVNREAQAFGGVPVDLHVRGFAAPIGVDEDPVTGSLNAGLAQWLIGDGLMPASYVAAQGQCLGRDGRVYLERDASGQVWVGGGSVTCIEGQVSL